MYLDQFNSSYSPITTPLVDWVNAYTLSDLFVSSEISSRLLCFWISPALLLDGAGHAVLSSAKIVHAISMFCIFDPLSLLGFDQPKKAMESYCWTIEEAFTHMGKALSSLILAVSNLFLTLLSPNWAILAVRGAGHSRIPKRPLFPIYADKLENEFASHLERSREIAQAGLKCALTVSADYELKLPSVQRSAPQLWKLSEQLSQMRLPENTMSLKSLKALTEFIERAVWYLDSSSDENFHLALEAFQRVAGDTRILNMRKERLIVPSLQKSVEDILAHATNTRQKQVIFIETAAKLIPIYLSYIEERSRGAWKEDPHFTEEKWNTLQYQLESMKETNQAVLSRLTDLVRPTKPVSSLGKENVRFKRFKVKSFAEKVRIWTLKLKEIGPWLIEKCAKAPKDIDSKELKQLKITIWNRFDFGVKSELLIELLSTQKIKKIEYWRSAAFPLPKKRPSGEYFSEADRQIWDYERKECDAKIYEEFEKFILESEAWEKHLEYNRMTDVLGRLESIGETKVRIDSRGQIARLRVSLLRAIKEMEAPPMKKKKGESISLTPLQKFLELRKDEKKRIKEQDTILA